MLVIVQLIKHNKCILSNAMGKLFIVCFSYVVWFIICLMKGGNLNGEICSETVRR